MANKQEIHSLAESREVWARKEAIYQLIKSFADLPDKQKAFKDLIQFSSYDNSDLQRSATSAICSAFILVPDKQKAWDDLIFFIPNKRYIRWSVAFVIRSIFEKVPDKQKAWDDLIRLSSDYGSDVRRSATSAICSAFMQVPDKQKAWNNLICLISDNNSCVRWNVASVIVSTFTMVPDKQKAWDDLIRFTIDNDIGVRWRVVSTIGSAFILVPDKQKAWDDLIRFTSDIDSDVRRRAALAIGSAFRLVPDKQKAWDELIRLASDNESDVRRSAALAIGSAFMLVPDKQKVWDDLIYLTSNTNGCVRMSAALAIGSSFIQVPKEQKVWDDLIHLTFNNDSYVRRGAASAIGSTLKIVPDKQKAWDYLIYLTINNDIEVRKDATSAICSLLMTVPDTQKAWTDLIRLTSNNDRDVRKGAASAIDSAFMLVPDKQKAWNDLIYLSSDYSSDYSSYYNSDVRKSATSVIGNAFMLVPDKQKAWDYQVHFISHPHNDKIVPYIDLLGSAFSHLPDKKKAWDDLIRLTLDDSIYVRASVYHSLGKVSILRAGNAATDEDFRKQMEVAIEFFQKSMNQGIFYLQSSNQAEFCLAFYRSFYTLTGGKKREVVSGFVEDNSNDLGLLQSLAKEIKRAVSGFLEYFSNQFPMMYIIPPLKRLYNAHKFRKEKSEVKRYLSKARMAVGDSKNREYLIEAVENLGNALNAVQNFGENDFNTVKHNFNIYRRYCERACELLAITEKKAPGASNVIRRGLPIIDERIKKRLEEIRDKTETFRKQTKNTPLDNVGKEICIRGQALSSINDPTKLEKGIAHMTVNLSAACAKFHEEGLVEACKLLKEVHEEKYIENKIDLINKVLDIMITKGKNSVKIEIREINNSNIGQIGNGHVIMNLSDNPQKEFSNKTLKSSIELFFQEKQDIIRELAKKFSTYLNRPSVITEEVIKDWLLQFGNITRIKFALRLLANIDYYEPQQMKEIFIHFYEKIIDKNDREQVIISLLGNPKDSSSIVNYTMGEVFMRYKLESHPLETILNSLNPDKKVIIFIDDNIGSGKQAVQIFREWFGIEKRDLNESHVKPLSDEQKEKFKRSRIYLCTFVGFEDGKEYVSVELKKMGLNVVKVYSFLKSEEEIGCFHKALKTFDNEEERVQAENMAREIGFQLFEDKDWSDEIKNKRSLGYGNSQKLLVFFYNTPTSTLPILWKEGRYNGKKWLPLFPRREKK